MLFYYNKTLGCAAIWLNMARLGRGINAAAGTWMGQKKSPVVGWRLRLTYVKRLV